MSGRYKSLEAVAGWYSLLGWLNLGCGVLVALVMVLISGRADSVLVALGVACVVLVAAAIITVTLWAMSNLIRLAIDCEDHLRTMRVLQREQRDELMR